MFNDAEIVGVDNDEMQALFGRDVTVLTGQQFGMGHPGNTKAGDWKTVTVPWATLLDAPLTRHVVAKEKHGPCIVFGSSVKGQRKALAMDTLYAMALDIDSGASMQKVIDRILELGLHAILYTTHSHLKSGIEIKRDDVIKKLGLTSHEITDNDVRVYLRDHHKDQYEPEFVAAVTIREIVQGESGMTIACDSPPIEKFRVIFPLIEPVKIVGLSLRQDDSLKMWADAITGLAVKMLGVHFDVACTDPSRLFYIPKHGKDRPFRSVVVRGRPLAFDEVKPFAKNSYAKERRIAGSNPFLDAAGDDGRSERVVPQVFAPESGNSLNEWNRKFGHRWEINNVLRNYCEDRLRSASGDSEDKVHTECVWEATHSNPGEGTATMVVGPLGQSYVNAKGEDVQSWGYVCRHDACQGRHKLEALRDMLEAGWFDESALVDEAFLLPAEDDEVDVEIAEEAAQEAEEAAKTPEAPPAPKTLADRVSEALSKASSEEDVVKFLAKMARRGIDKADRVRLQEAIVAATVLGKRDVTALISEAIADEEQRRLDLDPENVKRPPPINSTDFHDLNQYARERIDAAQKRSAWLFNYMEGLVRITDNADSEARIKMLNEASFAHELNKVATFEREIGDTGARIGVAAPPEVVKHLYYGDNSTYPLLRGLVTSPIFSKDGDLIDQRGYHEGSGLYYSPNHRLHIPPVADKPTAADVDRAKRLLLEETFFDFPLGGKTRDELMAATFGDAPPVPAVANLMALQLLGFARELIAGPTPGHLLTKPQPGTGASLATELVTIIAQGRAAESEKLPSNDDEMTKVLTTLLQDGENFIFFDNINHSVDSGALASAMTAENYGARVLGKTERVKTEVRAVWVLTGNNVSLSGELVRRLIMIDLDTRSPHPETRSNWRHADVKAWVKANRGDLVWACLTLVQNWIALGRPAGTAKPLASFEVWTNVMGGILEAAGIGGFMENREDLKARATDDTGNAFYVLLAQWWADHGSMRIPIRDGDPQVPSVASVAVRHDIDLPLRKEVGVDGERTYGQAALGKLLAQQRTRVFDLGDGLYVRLEAETPTGPKAKGVLWHLTDVTPAPKGNV